MEVRDAAAVGCILGTAVGDALGLAAEGMSRRRQRCFFPCLDRPRFFCGKGMVSDDTEHTCMVAQALIVAGGDLDRFTRSLAWRLRFWLLGLPAGIGRATLRAVVRLWLGFPASSAGVFSAGNGPSMRSALLGVSLGDDPVRLRDWVRGSTRLTHSDPKAEYGAYAVALAAHWSAAREAVAPAEFLDALRRDLGADATQFTDLVARAVASAAAGEATETFADSLGLQRGVSGYTYHTVPVVLHAWYRHPRNFRTAVLDVVHCGGDTDTTGAILGGIIGAGVGKAGIPPDWLGAVWEWPRSVAWMEQLGRRLAAAPASSFRQPALRLFVPGLLLRNLLFLALVLAHALRRLGPPY